MKKLLLLTNFICLYLFFSSCQNRASKRIENIAEEKLTIKDSILAVDTSKVSKQSVVSGPIEVAIGTKKDTTIKPAEVKAIIHKAPDQAKIDSIKKAKLKNKK